MQPADSWSDVYMKYIIFLFIACSIGGCTSFFQKTKVSYTHQAKKISQPARPSMVTQKLLSQFNEWKGTRYRKGGLSKKGIDCSGFVQITFRSKFGIDVPRETEQQVQIGRSVPRSNLQAGDLIFFKTGLFSRHVGMYLSGLRFLHASSTRGVIISSLKEEYWSDHYWLAKRVKK